MLQLNLDLYAVCESVCRGVGRVVGWGVPITSRVHIYLPSGSNSVISEHVTEIHQSAHTVCLWGRKVNVSLEALGFPLVLAQFQSLGNYEPLMSDYVACYLEDRATLKH